MQQLPLLALKEEPPKEDPDESDSDSEDEAQQQQQQNARVTLEDAPSSLKCVHKPR